MNNPLTVTVLGSTGSIGTSTLDVLARHPDRFRVHALTASSQVEMMLSQCVRFRPRFAVMVQEAAGRTLAEQVRVHGLDVQVRWGAQALDEVASDPQVQAVMAAIVGAAGLSPCLAAARAGKRLLLANKEALVVGGDIFMQAVREGDALILKINGTTYQVRIDSYFSNDGVNWRSCALWGLGQGGSLPCCCSRAPWSPPPPLARGSWPRPWP